MTDETETEGPTLKDRLGAEKFAELMQRTQEEDD